MSEIHPKAITLATDLGRLLKAYVPHAEDGHALIELLEAFRHGLAEPARRNVKVDVPIARFDGETPRADLGFRIDAPEALSLAFSSTQVIAAPADDPSAAVARMAQPGVVIFFGEDASTFCLFSMDRHGNEEHREMPFK